METINLEGNQWSESQYNSTSELFKRENLHTETDTHKRESDMKAVREDGHPTRVDGHPFPKPRDPKY